MILYSANDMARLGCNECSGCSSCCREMGQSIILDPYDIYQLQIATGQTFAQLMQDKIDLHVEDGIILPSIRMQDGTDVCGFLNREGRCSIHAFRPGLCRLFPLGRNYDEKGLRYFLLEDACQMQNRTKTKIKKWLGIEALPKYEQFLIVWHDLRRNVQAQITEQKSDDFTKKVNLMILDNFYQRPYDTSMDFYSQFNERRKAVTI